MEALGNSVVVGGVSSISGGRAWIPRRLWLARGRPRHAGPLQFGLMAPLTVPYIIIGLGLLSMFGALGIDRSLITVGIGHVVINLPLCFAIVIRSWASIRRISSAPPTISAPAICRRFCG